MVLAGTMVHAELPLPDLTVAADGSGDFKTVQAAVESLARTNTERKIIFLKDGVYHEKVRVDASCVTLRGQSRKGTRIEFAQLNDDFTKSPDSLGRAVLNLSEGANDFVLENLTVANTAGVVGPHAFAVFGKADRTAIVDCEVLSDGADTVSLWSGERGRYYHANCNFRGAVDFVCPRGWCYVTNCHFFEVKNTAATWHDGSKNQDQKFVLRGCQFDGTNGWVLARHHLDAQLYYLDCQFSATLADRAPRRVVYPLGGGEPSEADKKKNAENDAHNLWGERNYFWNCHRVGGDFAWFTNQLPEKISASDVTAAWTFAGKWNPENTNGPTIQKISRAGEKLSVTFSEPMTVKGQPQLKLAEQGTADYASGSGSATLVFKTTARGKVLALEANGGWVVASEASAALRIADLRLPPDLN
jgi:pectinesterase